MNRTGNFLMRLFLIVIFSTLSHISWTQEMETLNLLIQENKVIQGTTSSDLPPKKFTQENIVIESQIIDKIKKTEEEVENMRKNIEIPSLTELPSEELKKKLDEYGEKIKFLKTFGIPIKPEDYLNHETDFYFKGKYELALKACDRTIEIKPDYANAWFNKSVALNNLGRYDEALKACDKAIELKPDYVEALGNKGVALGNLGHYDEALKSYDKVIEIQPDDAKAWWNKACAYSLKGDKKEAFKDLSKAISLDPKYKDIVKKDEGFKNLWDDEDFKKIVN